MISKKQDIVLRYLMQLITGYKPMFISAAQTNRRN